MKKIILAAMAAAAMLAFASTADARVHYGKRSQYSANLEEPDPFGSIFDGWGENVTPQLHFKSSKQARRYYEKREANYGFDRSDDSYSGSIVALGHQLQRQGLRVSEHPSFGGVHHVHHGWAHYAGRAIDINVGRGVYEARSGHAHQFDQLAANLRAEGYTVLWRVAGHFNHMHVQK
jgi:hypothetical protein